MHHFHKIILTSALVLSAAASHAYGSGERNIKPQLARAITTPVFDAAIEFGGDDVATVFFAGGGSETLEAGEGFSFAGGFKHLLEGHQTYIKGTIGYKFANTAATNADISITSFPIHLSVGQRLDKDWHVSAGVTYQLNTEFDADGFGSNTDFDNAVGLSFGIYFKWLGLTYTLLDLESDSGGGTVNADNIGIRFSSVLFE